MFGQYYSYIFVIDIRNEVDLADLEMSISLKISSGYGKASGVSSTVLVKITQSFF